MGSLSLLFLCVFLGAAQHQGSTALTPVFVQKGNDVQLNVTEPVPEYLLFSWILNKKEEIPIANFPPDKNPKVTSAYTGRIEFPAQNYSVIVKNLQEADSGVYFAKVTGDKVNKVAEYNVTVLDPVSPVGLKVNSVSNSSESCNLTVTCSAKDAHINSTFRCDPQGCHQEGGEPSVTASGASLQIYLDNGTIICNHSNQVSLTEDKTNIRIACQRSEVLTGGNTAGPVVGGVVVGGLFVVFLVLGVVAVRNKKKKRHVTIQDQNTTYEVPQLNSTASPQTSTPVPNGLGIPPNTTYCMVGPHTGPMRPSETQRNQQPESLYAKVDKAARS